MSQENVHWELFLCVCPPLGLFLFSPLFPMLPVLPVLGPFPLPLPFFPPRPLLPLSCLPFLSLYAAMVACGPLRRPAPALLRSLRLPFFV